ncbi:MAG: hypothetical protein JJE18_02510 [Eubacteriaceae bacterium]|nr:hypothetical protein [Eubacteriaceae bacterium]
MHEDVKTEREKRKKIRQRKKMRSTIVAITLLIVIMTVGVVNAQTQGYEVFYQGHSLGFVRTMGVFDSAVEQLEAGLRKSYNNDAITLGNGFELAQGRVENPMNLETCNQVLLNSGIELYVNGAIILIDNQEIGALASLDEAQSLIKTYENLYPNANNIRTIETTIPLADTKDFGTILSHIKGMNK